MSTHKIQPGGIIYANQKFKPFFKNSVFYIIELDQIALFEEFGSYCYLVTGPKHLMSGYAGSIIKRKSNALFRQAVIYLGEL